MFSNNIVMGAPVVLLPKTPVFINGASVSFLEVPPFFPALLLPISDLKSFKPILIPEGQPFITTPTISP